MDSVLSLSLIMSRPWTILLDMGQCDALLRLSSMTLSLA